MIVNKISNAINDLTGNGELYGSEAEEKLRLAVINLASFALRDLTGKHRKAALRMASSTADFINVMQEGRSD